MGGLGTLSAFFAAYLKFRKDLMNKYDLSPRKIRIKHYKKLYTYLTLLANYPRQKQLTTEELYNLSETLSCWHHKEAGLFLSHSSRKGYDNLQKKIREAISKSVVYSQCELQTKLLNNVRNAAHELRANRPC